MCGKRELVYFVLCEWQLLDQIIRPPFSTPTHTCEVHRKTHVHFILLQYSTNPFSITESVIRIVRRWVGNGVGAENLYVCSRVADFVFRLSTRAHANMRFSKYHHLFKSICSPYVPYAYKYICYCVRLHLSNFQRIAWIWLWFCFLVITYVSYAHISECVFVRTCAPTAPENKTSFQLERRASACEYIFFGKITRQTNINSVHSAYLF